MTDKEECVVHRQDAIPVGVLKLAIACPRLTGQEAELDGVEEVEEEPQDVAEVQPAVAVQVAGYPQNIGRQVFPTRRAFVFETFSPARRIVPGFRRRCR